MALNLSMPDQSWGGQQVGAPMSRADTAAALIENLATEAGLNGRLGSKNDVRQVCLVSVGTFNEALKIAQARGIVTLRRGPGGGIFAAAQSPLIKLGNRMLALDGKQSVVADALRMRNALDSLTIEDALRYSSAADIEKMRKEIVHMREAMDAGDVRAFLHGNWRFQACVASVTPNAMLRTVFLSLLDILEENAVALRPATDQPTQEMLEERMDLYVGMADALEKRDRDSAMRIMTVHNSGTQPSSEA